MKQNVAINLNFASSPVASQFINIPFPVSAINFKAILYNAAVSTGSYVYLTSDLVMNQPVGMAFQSTTSPLALEQGISYEFENPIPVGGSYTFSMYFAGGQLALATGADKVTIIAEFVGVV